MNEAFSFTFHEAAIIRSWYDFVIDESMHYGGGGVIFPTEIMLLNKIARSQKEKLLFTTAEIGLIADWMKKAVGGKYGSSEHLCGFELQVYRKITSLLSSTNK
jgi:hypothetical protein